MGSPSGGGKERERSERVRAEQALTKKHIKCDGKQYEKRIHLSDKVHSENE